MLKEVNTGVNHYYVDELGRWQGESASWWAEDQYRVRSRTMWKDNKRHGEHRYSIPNWSGDRSSVLFWEFYQHGKDITIQVTPLINDLSSITNEERLMIKIKFGIECLS